MAVGGVQISMCSSTRFCIRYFLIRSAVVPGVFMFAQTMPDRCILLPIVIFEAILTPSVHLPQNGSETKDFTKMEKKRKKDVKVHHQPSPSYFSSFTLPKGEIRVFNPPGLSVTKLLCVHSASLTTQRARVHLPALCPRQPAVIYRAPVTIATLLYQVSKTLSTRVSLLL